MSFACRFNGGSSLDGGGTGGGGSTGGSLRVTISPTSDSSSDVLPNGTSGPYTATPTDGTGSYTYLWTVEFNANDASVAFSASTSAVTNVTLGDVNTSDSDEVTIKCTVTDSSGSSAWDYATATHTNTSVA